MNGTSNTVTLNSGTVTLENGASASINGSNNRIQGVGSTSITVSGSGDTLIAGSGATVMTNTGTLGFYDYGQGAGSATIVNGAPSNWTASNELDFGSGLNSENLCFEKSGNNLQIDIMGTTNEVTVQGWFSSPSSQLQEITAGGLKLDSQLSQLVQAMASYSAAHTGFNPAIAESAPADSMLQSPIAHAWHK
jgi:serralysin